MKGYLKYNNEFHQFTFKNKDIVSSAAKKAEKKFNLPESSVRLYFFGKFVDPTLKFSQISFREFDFFDIVTTKSIETETLKKDEFPILPQQKISQFANEESIRGIMELGFSRDVAIRALDVAKGDVQTAIERILNNDLPPPKREIIYMKDTISAEFLMVGWKDHLRSLIMTDSSNFGKIIQNFNMLDSTVTTYLLEHRDFLSSILGLTKEELDEIYPDQHKEQCVLPEDDDDEDEELARAIRYSRENPLVDSNNDGGSDIEKYERIINSFFDKIKEEAEKEKPDSELHEDYMGFASGKGEDYEYSYESISEEEEKKEEIDISSTDKIQGAAGLTNEELNEIKQIKASLTKAELEDVRDLIKETGQTEYMILNFYMACDKNKKSVLDMLM